MAVSWSATSAPGPALGRWSIARSYLSPDKFGFIVLCGAMTAFPAMSIDMSLPALTVTAAAFGASGASIALTLTLFLAGFSIAPLLYGPMSDQIGRRPVLIGGCFGYAVASLLCSTAQSLDALLWWRLVQGTCAGAPSVLALSVIRDAHDGPRARTLFSYAAIIRLIAPMLAPSLGAALMTIASWRWIYGVMVVGATSILLCVLFGLEESAPRISRAARGPLSIARSYRTLLTTPLYVGYTTVIGFLFGSHLSYVTGSSLVMMDVFHLRPDVYAVLFGAGALGIMTASFLSGRLNARGNSGTSLILTGLVVATLSASTMTGFTLAGLGTMPLIACFLVVNCFCFGLIMPSAQQAALQPVPSVSGAASALLNALAMGGGTVASLAVGALFARCGTLAMTGMMAGFSGLALVTFLVTRAWERAHAATRPGRP